MSKKLVRSGSGGVSAELRCSVRMLPPQLAAAASSCFTATVACFLMEVELGPRSPGFIHTKAPQQDFSSVASIDWTALCVCVWAGGFKRLSLSSSKAQ